MLSINPKQPTKPWIVLGPLLRLSWPIAVSMLSYSVMTAVDTLFVGGNGADSIAAVGLGGLASFTILTFALGLLRGGKVLASNAFGAGDHSKIDNLARANLIVSIIFAAVTLLLTLAVAPLLRHSFAEPGQVICWCATWQFAPSRYHFISWRHLCARVAKRSATVGVRWSRQLRRI